MKLRNLFRFSAKENIEIVFSSKKEREELFDDLEEQLILSDIPVTIAERIIQKGKISLKTPFTRDEFLTVLRNEITNVIEGVYKKVETGDSMLPLSNLKLKISPDKKRDIKKVFLFVGVNGSGKTTTAAKLAYKMKKEGEKVLLCASDTFRAAGSSQLMMWGEKLGIPVVGGDHGADPGSVVFNGMNSLMNKDYTAVIIDTAGRVQTKENLMRELEKITKIIKKFIPSGPSETLLVIDATMGQNTFDQAIKFGEFSGLTGIVLTKLDGTAKGGAVLRIIEETGIPVLFVGTGEKESDIEEFSTDEFVRSFVED
ncbi:MAG: signal recognition particle-docking protein FtsY [Candidatus Aminicenantes bacterium]|nr:signal recognition particle-docking protein FtsY [Candidatus Aminicenantes bacterium]